MQENEYMERIVSTVYDAGALGPGAMSDVVNALVEGIALCSAATDSPEGHAIFLSTVCAHIRERGAELRESYQEYMKNAPCDDPACPAHGTRH